MVKDLKDLTFELDNATSDIERHVETLNDLNIKLGHLRDSMDSAVYKGDGGLYYREHHREVRILNDLMSYVMKDLIDASAKAYKLNTELHEIVRGE